MPAISQFSKQFLTQCDYFCKKKKKNEEEKNTARSTGIGKESHGGSSVRLQQLNVSGLISFPSGNTYYFHVIFCPSAL